MRRSRPPEPTVAAPILRGTIKTIKPTEGFGFIVHTATGEEYFFHRSALAPDVVWPDLTTHQRVEFVPSEGPKGHRATQVRPF